MDTETPQTSHPDEPKSPPRRYQRSKAPKKAKEVATFRRFEGHEKHVAGARANEIAQVLEWRLKNNLTWDEIARLVGKDRKTVSEMAAPFIALLENPEAVREFKHHEAEMLDAVRLLMVQGMTEQLTDPERRKKLDLSRLTWGFSALFDKARLERGESTTNVKLSLAELVNKTHEKDITEIQDAEIISEEAK